MSAWLRELGLGARLALAGGRGATLLTAVGVGLGVGLLLLAASVPTALQLREDRAEARDSSTFAGEGLTAGPGTLLIASADTEFRRAAIRGRVLRAEGPAAPVPPGLQALPGPGELVVSPALAELLRAPGSELLRQRLAGRIVGTISADGLIGPRELAYYAGSDALVAGLGSTTRIERFGLGGVQFRPLDPVLLLLVVVLFVVTLVPLGVFIATAVRFGGEQRDRRLAALRLVGADRMMVRRIAAGETLVGALLGLVLGAAGFVTLRPLVERITLWDVSVFAGDLDPSPVMAALIVLLVPAAAVLITLASLRLVVIEPLGVVRRSLGRPRRLLWRLVLPVLGLLALLPLAGSVSSDGSDVDRYQVAAGAAGLLIGVAALLPWLVEAVVRRLRGTTVGGQLAIRRLQLSPETSARTVSGIAVAAAGAIALQMLFAGVRDDYRAQETAEPQVTLPAAPGAPAPSAEAVERRLAATPGIAAVEAVQRTGATMDGATDPSSGLAVGSCASLRSASGGAIGACADGDVFLVADEPTTEAGALPDPGDTIAVGDPLFDGSTASLPRWTVPVSARAVQADADASISGVYATTGAVPADVLEAVTVNALVRLDATAPEAVEELRTAAAGLSPVADVFVIQPTQEDRRFSSVRRGLYLGAAATLALIGASMLVSLLEGLRQRRRLLAVLVAFGTRRATLGWSVVVQTAVPVAIGLVLAIGVGVLLGAVLLAMVSRPVSLDVGSIAVVCATGLGVVAAVTALGMPALWRLMRPDGLRTE